MNKLLFLLSIPCCCASAQTAPRTSDVWQKAGAGDGLRQAFERAIYALKDSGHGVWRGQNRAQRLALQFDSSGARLTHPEGSTGFRLTGYGYGKRLGKPAPARLTATGDRLEYQRGNLIEWYENSSQGLEQGFTFARRPVGGIGSEPLTIALRVSGDLALQQKDGAVLLASGKGVVLRYAGLTARDARGRIFPSRMEVRDSEIRLLVEDREAQYPLVVDPAWTQQVELTATGGAANDSFGASVSLSGGTALVGAPSLSTHGAAYVFTQSGGIWTQQAVLTASDGADGDGFGSSVSVDGDTAVIGAPFQLTSTGVAYVFTRSVTTWSPQAELTASDDPAQNDRFGASVSVNGGTAVIGAPGHFSQGTAYIFVSPAWSLQQELVAPDGAENDGFGTSVSVSGVTALIGATSAGGGTGSVYTFTQSDTTWSFGQEMTGRAVTNDKFGSSVSVSGATALIGAEGTTSGRGAAYVFVLFEGNWSLQGATLTASDGLAGDHFGASVSVSGGTAVIGAPDHQVGSNAGQGEAYVFTQGDPDWTQQAMLTNGGAAFDNFGNSVSVSGGTAVIGAPGVSDVNEDAGAAYVFTIPASLSISATHIDPFFTGVPGTLTMTVDNAGGPTIGTATVSDTIDSSFTINSVSAGCLASLQIVTCTLAAGAPAASTPFNVSVTATDPETVSNTATLTDGTDPTDITNSSSTDTVNVVDAGSNLDLNLSDGVLSGTTDNGPCADGNSTLTASDQLTNTGSLTLTNPHAVIDMLTGSNSLISQSVDSVTVNPGDHVTFTFHVHLASCDPFTLRFDVFGQSGP